MLSPSLHNVIKISRHFERIFFKKFMRLHELHMQKSFQFNHDKGASGYHTHEHSKLTKATDRSEKVFTASCTTLSLLGKIATSNLTFAKANFEIEPMTKNQGNQRNIECRTFNVM